MSRHIVCSLALFSLGCIETAVVPGGDPNVGPGPDILVTPPALTWGEQALGEADVRSFSVQNVGEATLHVDNVLVESGLGFTVPPGTAFDLAPGESRDVEVVFEPMGANENYGRVLVLSDDHDTPEAAVDLLGYGSVPELKITPETYVFGDAFVPCGASVELELENVGNEVLVVSSLDYTSGGALSLDASAVALPLTLAPGATAHVTVDFAAADTATDTGRLDVGSNDPRGVVSADQNGEGAYADEHAETFTEPGVPPVDVLLLVDNSGSMEDDNVDDVQAGVPDFVAELQTVSDWQMMLVTADSGCATGGILDPSHPSPANWIVNHAFDGGGDDTERLLELAGRSLSLTGPNQCNAGFLRPGALLHVIVLSDEEEQSGRDGEDWVADFQQLVATPSHLKISGVLDLNRNCGDNSGPGGYEEAIDATGGAKLDICNANWGRQFSDIASEVLAGIRTYNLAAEPHPPSVEVTVNGNRTTDFTVIGSDVTIASPPIGEGDVVEIAYGVLAECE